MSAAEDHGPGCDGPLNCTCPDEHERTRTALLAFAGRQVEYLTVDGRWVPGHSGRVLFGRPEDDYAGRWALSLIGPVRSVYVLDPSHLRLPAGAS